jgi:hypothetical protein
LSLYYYDDNPVAKKMMSIHFAGTIAETTAPNVELSPVIAGFTIHAGNVPDPNLQKRGVGQLQLNAGL